jgi:plasmid stability protein
LCGDQTDVRVFRNECGGVQMSSILVRGLDEKTIERLKERARLNGRSLQEEVKTLLEHAAETLSMREARRLSERWNRRLDGRSLSDSTELIREDRDSR